MAAESSFGEKRSRGGKKGIPDGKVPHSIRHAEKGYPDLLKGAVQ
jgi:hypothetical protein